VPAVFDDYIKRLVNIEVLEDEPENPTVEVLTTEP
jgi:hypothetical protein